MIQAIVEDMEPFLLSSVKGWSPVFRLLSVADACGTHVGDAHRHDGIPDPAILGISDWDTWLAS